MNIDELTLGQIKEIQNILKEEERKSILEIGKNYFVRTVTHYFVGRLIRLEKNEILLNGASWIADTGRFSDALKSGNFNEVEPFPDEAIINRQAIIDVCPWDHDLPREQK